MKPEHHLQKLIAVKSADGSKSNFDQAEKSARSDTSSPMRWGFLVLFVGLGGFLLWAGLAPLDEGVPMQGVVSIDTKPKPVQHLSGGIVKEVSVKEGQMVKRGDVLMTLDNITAKAKYEQTRQKYIGDRALESRLLAEQTGARTISFHKDLLMMRSDPAVQQGMNNQEMLLTSRRAALNADLQGTEESIHGMEAQIHGLSGVLESRRSQLALLNEQLSNIRSLVDEGYAPRNQQVDLELKVAQTTSDIADAESQMVRATHAISELKQRMQLRREEYRKEVDTQMPQVHVEAEAGAGILAAQKDDLNREVIRSPADGQVVGLQFQTPGSVIQPGQKILEVVPVNEGLLLEAKIAPHLIDKLHPGQFADIRFDSFSNSPQLAVEGRVDSISRDLLTEPGMNPAAPGASYYLARISITAKGRKTLGARVLQSGMPVQVIVKTGERSMLTYLMHPLVKRFAASLKEE
ncbi:type I secretion system membrane fusion protein PrsE [mine drainage metagenome]|uniref:Type I secretion system membrane fusion protein PrsE n=1 Tax=mine drainage metagenome TaxID=410659 RepID=A0A1J5PI78_9ZZZZ